MGADSQNEKNSLFLKDVVRIESTKISVDEINISDYISTENMVPDLGGVFEAKSKPLKGSVTKFQKDDILISNIRPYLKKIWFSDKKGGCSSDVLVFRIKNDEIDSKYLFYLLSSDKFFNYVMTTSKGTKMPRGDKKAILKFKIKVPTLIQQKNYANFLSLIDKKIELLEKKYYSFEQIKKCYLNEIFNFNDNINQNSLGNLCSIQTGKLDANAMVENGAYRFYTCAKEYYKIDNYEFDTEALLISGNGANVGYIHYYNGKFNAYQRTYVLDNFDKSVEIKYVKYFLEKNLHKQIWKEKKEGNTPYIVLSTLRDMQIFYPELSEQKNIVQLLINIDKKLSLINNQVMSIKKFKKGLLQKMFV